MSNKLTVFENHTKAMSFFEMSMFKESCEMPWTYYECEVLNSTDSNLSSVQKVDARRRLMWTSRSAPIHENPEIREQYPKTEQEAIQEYYAEHWNGFKPHEHPKRSGKSFELAGNAVTEIKRIVKIGSSYQEETIAFPNPDDYLKWGWPLDKDENNKYIPPMFGEFSFRPGTQPNFEDAEDIYFKVKVGSGLNGRCYNYRTSDFEINVTNISTAPSFFLTENPTCQPKWDKLNGTWNNDMKIVDYGTTRAETVTSRTLAEVDYNIKEGDSSESKLYLLIRVEKGEKLLIESIGTAHGDIRVKVGRHLTTAGNNTAETESATFDDDGFPSGAKRLLNPYRTNVVGESIGSLNVTYDFYRVELSLTESNNTYAYMSDTLKRLNLCFTPVSNNTINTNFCTILNLLLNVVPNNKEVYIRDDLNIENHGFVDGEFTDEHNEARDLSDQSNLRARNIVTSEEAIAYALKSGENLGGLIQDGETISDMNDVLLRYKKSLLTNTELKLAEYKYSFGQDDEKMKKLLYYIAIDMSEHALDNFSSFVVKIMTMTQ